MTKPTRNLETTIFEAMQIALTGPKTDDPRQSGTSRERLEFFTDAVAAAVRKNFNLVPLHPKADPLPTFDLKPGHGVVIRAMKKANGAGEQYAHVMPMNGRTRGAYNHRVRIWRHEQRKWTKPRSLTPDEIIRKASDEDMRTFKPEFGPIWDENW